MNEKFSRESLIKMLRSSLEQLEWQEQLEDEFLTILEEKTDAEEFRTPTVPKYKMVYDKRLFSEANCPVCGFTVYRNDSYCSNCGQAIDWSENEPEVTE